jgi:hypothetical protein
MRLTLGILSILLVTGAAGAPGGEDFPVRTDLPGDPPPDGVRYWQGPFRSVQAQGAYVSVFVVGGGAERRWELWQNTWGDDVASRGIVVRRGPALDGLGKEEMVCDGTLITDVPDPQSPKQPAPKRGYTRTAMTRDDELGYVMFCCVCPDYLPGTVPLLPAALVSKTGEKGTFRYLGKLQGEPQEEAARRTVWSDGGSLVRLSDGRWGAYVNGFGRVLSAMESDQLTGQWKFLRDEGGAIRELLPDFPSGPNYGGCFPTVLRVSETNWHAWITDTWPPQSIWHFRSADGIAWKPFGKQPEITRAAVGGKPIKCLRARVDPDKGEVVGLLSVWQEGSDGETHWVLHESRMSADRAP